ncbi:MAG: thiamine-phosphate pyrophosphorylase [Candidatus Omnitrophota bacterium]
MLKIDKKILRLIDANLNRAKEGLRVCEDLARFTLNARALTEDLKKIRHGVFVAIKVLAPDLSVILESRDIRQDVGKMTTRAELSRRDLEDIFFANIQRSKEAMRVLEETSKLYNQKASRQFKILRYKIYDLEKRFALLHFGPRHT